jgi:hypothetical protein
MPPIVSVGGEAGAGAGAGAALRRAAFLFVFLLLFAFMPFFFRAGAARFAVFFVFFAFAFLRFFAMIFILPEWFNPHALTTGEAAGVSVTARTPLP